MRVLVGGAARKKREFIVRCRQVVFLPVVPPAHDTMRFGLLFFVRSSSDARTDVRQQAEAKRQEFLRRLNTSLRCPALFGGVAAG